MLPLYLKALTLETPFINTKRTSSHRKHHRINNCSLKSVYVSSPISKSLWISGPTRIENSAALCLDCNPPGTGSWTYVCAKYVVSHGMLLCTTVTIHLLRVMTVQRAIHTYMHAFVQFPQVFFIPYRIRSVHRIATREATNLNIASAETSQ